MELKLNIYGEEGKVVKTYTANDFDLMTGTCEDVLEAIGIDNLLATTGNTEELGKLIVGAVLKGYKTFRPFLFQCFHGLTEDEYEHTKIKEVGQIMVAIVLYTINQMFSMLTPADKEKKDSKSKNQ